MLFQCFVLFPCSLTCIHCLSPNPPPLTLSEGALGHAGLATDLPEFGAERSAAMVVQLQPRAPSPAPTQPTPVNHDPSPSHTPIMQDLQQQDSTSYVLLNLAKGESLKRHIEIDTY